jgi:hypothetical protein
VGHHSRWNLRPSNRNEGGYRPKDGEQNGVRIYQLMLNSMQMLPVANISQITEQQKTISAGSAKEKRKAAENIGPKTHKKACKEKEAIGRTVKEDVTMVEG